MSTLTGPVDHRPLVQAEAAQSSRPAGGGPEQGPDGVRSGPELVGQPGRIEPYAGCLLVVREARDLPELARVPAEHDTRSGEPALQPGGAIRVVGEQEVEDRVLLAPPAPLAVRVG